MTRSTSSVAALSTVTPRSRLIFAQPFATHRVMSLSTALIAGVSAGLAVAVPLGPIGVMIVDTGIRDGARPALAAGLGTATVDGLYATAAALFGAAIGAWLAPAADPLRIAAAAVLAAI